MRNRSRLPDLNGPPAWHLLGNPGDHPAYELLLETGAQVAGWWGSPSSASRGHEWCGDAQQLKLQARTLRRRARFFVVAADEQERTDWLRAVDELALRTDPIVHPTAWVATTAQVGRGVFIGVRAVVEAHATIEDFAVIGNAVVVGSRASVARSAHLRSATIVAPRAVVPPGTTSAFGEHIQHSS